MGNISKSDVLMAQTGSRLLIGFNVDTMPKLLQLIKEQGIEVRLYDTIYKLTADLKNIAENMIPKASEERITGKAKVIATFKGDRKGAIIGCEVLEGTLQTGKNFRVITAMGPAYFGTISSLQIERQHVNVGKTGQQVGLKITDWHKAKVGDLVECYETIRHRASGVWKPRGGVFRSTS